MASEAKDTPTNALIMAIAESLQDAVVEMIYQAREHGDTDFVSAVMEALDDEVGEIRDRLKAEIDDQRHRAETAESRRVEQYDYLLKMMRKVGFETDKTGDLTSYGFDVLVAMFADGVRAAEREITAAKNRSGEIEMQNNQLREALAEAKQAAATIRQNTQTKLGEFAKITDIIDAEAKRCGIEWHGSASTTLKAVIEEIREAPSGEPTLKESLTVAPPVSEQEGERAKWPGHWRQWQAPDKCGIDRNGKTIVVVYECSNTVGSSDVDARKFGYIIKESTQHATIREQAQEIERLQSQLQQANEQNSKQAVKILRLRQLPWDYSRPWTVADVNELERALSIEVAGTSPAYVPPSPSQPATTSPAAASAGSHCPACKAAAMVDGQCNNCGGSMCAGGSVFSAPAPVADKPHVMVPQDDPTCGPIIADGTAVAPIDTPGCPVCHNVDGMVCSACAHKNKPAQAAESEKWYADRDVLPLGHGVVRQLRYRGKITDEELAAAADWLNRRAETEQQLSEAKQNNRGTLRAIARLFGVQDNQPFNAEELPGRVEQLKAQLATYQQQADAWEKIDIRKIVNAAITALGGLRPSQEAFHESALHAAKVALASQLEQQEGSGT
jgi:polyhydroxyalkanoate synthesis regulator phasin